MRLLEIYKQNENWAQVDQLAQSVLAINPLRPDPHEQLLAAAHARGEKIRTIEPLSALLEMSPVDPAAFHYQLADALLAGGQPKLARRHVLRALENAPRYRQAQQLLLQLSDEAGQDPAAPVEKTNSPEN